MNSAFSASVHPSFNIFFIFLTLSPAIAAMLTKILSFRNIFVNNKFSKNKPVLKKKSTLMEGAHQTIQNCRQSSKSEQST
jgi:hypothetical protein